MNIEGHVRCTNSSFANGNAYQGGAICPWMWGVIEAENCSFTNNSAVGATHNTGGALFSDRGSVLLRGCRFVGNVANASGGALFAWSAHGSCKNLTLPSGEPSQSCQNITIESTTFTVRHTTTLTVASS